MTDAETPHLLTDPVIQVMPVGVAGGQWIYEVSINRAPAFKVKVDRETRGGPGVQPGRADGRG